MSRTDANPLSLCLTWMLVVGLLALAGQVGAATFYGHDDSFNVYFIDTDGPTVTLLGNGGGSYGPEIQLTPDGSTLLIATTSSELVHVSPTTGTQTGVVTVVYPTLPAPHDDLNVSTAMEYVGGTLYAAFDESGPETGPGYLGTINPANGATTAIGELTGMNAPAGGLAYSNGVMYAVSSANSVFSQLYTVDLATGAATLIADITYQGAQVEAMTALAIVDGVAYTKSNDTTGGVDNETLYTIDLSSGALTPVFDMGQFIIALTNAQTEQAEAIPTMGTWGFIVLVVGLGLAALLAIRRFSL